MRTNILKRLLPAIFALCLLLSACGGNNAGSGASVSGPEADSTESGNEAVSSLPDEEQTEPDAGEGESNDLNRETDHFDNDNIEEQTEEEQTMNNKITVSFNGHTYTATLENHSSAVEFVEYIKQKGGSLTISASDFGNFEKVGPLGTSIARNDTQITTVPGDIILYLGNKITVYYAQNSWDFTRLGRLNGDMSNLKADLGDGDVEITFSLAE